MTFKDHNDTDCCGRDITHDDYENGDYYYVASTDEYYCYDCEKIYIVIAVRILFR